MALYILTITVHQSAAILWIDRVQVNEKSASDVDSGIIADLVTFFHYFSYFIERVFSVSQAKK
jgi:hypothetical protein